MKPFRLGRQIKGNLILRIVLVGTLAASLTALSLSHILSVSKSCRLCKLSLSHYPSISSDGIITTTTTRSHLQDRTSLISSSLLPPLSSHLGSMEQPEGSFQNLKFSSCHSPDLMSPWFPLLLRGARTFPLFPLLPQFLSISPLCSQLQLSLFPQHI